MNVPLVDLKAGFEPIRDEVMKAVGAVFDSMQLKLGPNVCALEEEFAAFLGARHAIAVSNGTDALVVALKACGVGPGDDVLTVSHTFFATIEAIVHAGARPVFVDIEPETMTMDVSDAERKVTEKTRAIVPVHLYGHPAEMNALTALASANGLQIIEDACQAHGASHEGRMCGTIGRAAAFSFYCTKNVGSYGEGGMVTTDDDEVAREVRLLRNHGHTSKFTHARIGYNFRMHKLVAAVLRIKLRRLSEYNEARRALAARYNELLGGLPVRTPVEKPAARHVYHVYAIRTPERDRLAQALEEAGVGYGIHYKVPGHLQEATADLGYREGALPVTERVTAEILSLPIYPELTRAQQEYVAAVIRDFHG